MSELGWFLLFWNFLIALGLFEFVFARAEGGPNRGERWVANIGIGLINSVIASILPFTAVLAAHWAASQGIGLLNWTSAPLWIAVIVTVLARSLSQYVFHWLMHAVPALWLVHRVHHCDDHLDASTGLRFHPVEVIANTLLVAPIAIALGAPPLVLAAYESIEILIGIASHTSLRLPLAAERTLRWMFVTPGLHRLHHSEDPHYAGTNYGAVFSIWDRLFGTLSIAPLHGAALVFGVKGVSAKEAADLGALLILPWRAGRREDPDAPADLRDRADAVDRDFGRTPPA